MLLAVLSSSSEPETPSSEFMVLRSEDDTAAGSTDAFLASRLKFVKDENGQEICVVKAGDDEIGVSNKLFSGSTRIYLFFSVRS